MQDSCQEPDNEWVTKLRPKSLKNFALSEFVQLALWQHVRHCCQIRYSGIPPFAYGPIGPLGPVSLTVSHSESSLRLRLCSFCLALPFVTLHHIAVCWCPFQIFPCNLMVFFSHKLVQIAVFTQVPFKDPAQQQMAADSSPHSRWIAPIVLSGQRCRWIPVGSGARGATNNFSIFQHNHQHDTAPASSSANQRLDPGCTASSLASAQTHLTELAELTDSD